jgi:hypothetical protein
MVSDSKHITRSSGLTLVIELVQCQTGNSRGHLLCSNSHQNKLLKPSMDCV